MDGSRADDLDNVDEEEREDRRALEYSFHSEKHGYLHTQFNTST
jgi:hypothetical protein